ncbi:MAG: glycosyltransferase [Anaerolineae bacterium]|nr:glycosyltransferase [Anaerolineae bacterium]
MPAHVINLSVIIPCYNELKNLEAGVLDEVNAYLSQQHYIWEVIVSNDESSDGSRQFVSDFIQDKDNWSLVDIKHGGKPAAVWAGIQAARGEIILFTDMDQSTPITELEKLLPWYEQGYDVVIGSRGTHREGTSFFRQLGSIIFLTLRQLIILSQIRDTQCGFKSCRRQVALDTFPKLQFFKEQENPTGWKVSAYDVELLFLAQHMGYRLKDVEVEWYNRDLSDTKSPEGAMKRYIRESMEMAREVARVKMNQIKGNYNK